MLEFNFTPSNYTDADYETCPTDIIYDLNSFDIMTSNNADYYYTDNYTCGGAVVEYGRVKNSIA